MRCQVCRRHESEVGPISWRGKCGECGKRIANQAADDLHYHQGPYLLAWRRGMAKSVGALLVDDVLGED